MHSPGALALSTRGLRKSYGSRLALDGLDLSVPKDMVYGFLGPNGAGRTTTMRLTNWSGKKFGAAPEGAAPMLSR